MADVLRGDRAARADFCARMVCVSRILAARNNRIGSPLDQDELLDLIQDVHLSIWRRLDSYEGRAALESWAFRFCHLGMLKHLERRQRRDGRMQLRSNDVLSESTEGPLAGEAMEESESLASLLKHLSPREAEVTRLKYLEHLEFGEIAELLGISVSSAKTHCYRALVKLRDVHAPAERSAE